MDRPAELRLETIATELRENGSAPNPSVREFLSWFGQKRRGFLVVERVRGALESAGLHTVPDFEGAFIDTPVTFRLNHDGGRSEGEEPSDPSPTPYADPTFRISRLGAANQTLVTVCPTSTRGEAVTLMLRHDYSQLPVMTTIREVKGVISWRSIGSGLAMGNSGNTVADFMDPHVEVRAGDSLFSAIASIVKHEYVLVRASDNTISGIVTASDLSEQFRILTEPFLLLGEVENQIRRFVDARFTSAELANAKDPNDSDRSIDSVADLTLGEHIRLLDSESNWSRMPASLDRRVFIAGLDKIRRIRNDVMHFDPDGILPEDLDDLRDFARFLSGLMDRLGVAACKEDPA